MRDISLHLMDIIQNSIVAKATELQINFHADSLSDQLTLTIEDNGMGMDEAVLNHVTDPFTTTRTTRKVGLGIPLLKDSAERAGGTLDIQSVKGQGTKLKASFVISHIDRLPIGDIAETMVSLIIAGSDIHYRLICKSHHKEFVLDTAEIKKTLGEVPITHYEVTTWIHDYIKEGITDVFGGVLNEIDC